MQAMTLKIKGKAMG